MVKNRKRNGWVLLDAICGVCLLGVIGGIFVTSVNAQHRYLVRLADMRSAVRLAEGSLIQLSEHQALEPSVRVERLPYGEAVPGKVWVRITASVNGRSVSLVGLTTDTPALGGAHATQP